MKGNLIYLVIGVASGLLVAVLVLSFSWQVPTAVGQSDVDAVGAAMGQSEAEALNVAIGSGFTYQGLLENDGALADGAFDFQFTLYDAASVGITIGASITLSDVVVTEGLFSVKLDFGADAFGGGARWLQIAVRAGNSNGAYTPLTPRQELTPAPAAQSLPNVYSNESLNFVGVGRNFRISGNEVFGIRYTGEANDYGGMYVETEHANGWPFYGYATNGSFRAWTYYNGTNGDWYLYNAGIRLAVPNEGGLRIGPSADYSLVISNSTGSDGIRIYHTGDDAIQIGSAPDHSNYGVYIPSPGVSTYGLWPNTANVDGEWALFTVDNIAAGNVVASSLSQVAQVTGPEALTAGDVVAVTGMAAPLADAQSRLPVVTKADTTGFTGIIGVVDTRMVFALAPGKEDEGAMSLQSADGPAQAGDYVSLIVFGVADVKVESGATILPGERLAASDLPGQARTLQTRMVEGMEVTEGAQVIGIALAAPVEGQATIPVFVTLR